MNGSRRAHGDEKIRSTMFLMMMMSIYYNEEEELTRNDDDDIYDEALIHK